MTNETKFTPGPWQWSASGRLLHDVPGSHSETVLAISDRIWRPMEADARLIAAAPDMYDVLADIEDHLTSGRAARSEGYEEGQQLRARLQAALSKARGGQS